MTSRLDPERIASFERNFLERRRATELIRMLSRQFGAYRVDPWDPIPGDRYACSACNIRIGAEPFQVPEAWPNGNYWAELGANPFAWAFEEEIESRYAALLREVAIDTAWPPVEHSWAAIRDQLPPLTAAVPSARVLVLAGDVHRTVRFDFARDEQMGVEISRDDPVWRHNRVLGQPYDDHLIAVWFKDEGQPAAAFVVDWSRFAMMTARPMPDTDGELRDQLIRIRESDDDPLHEQVNIVIRESTVLSLADASAATGFLLAPFDESSMSRRAQ